MPRDAFPGTLGGRKLSKVRCRTLPGCLHVAKNMFLLKRNKHFHESHFPEKKDVPGPLWPLLRDPFPTLRCLNAVEEDQQRLCAEPSKNVVLTGKEKSPKWHLDGGNIWKLSEGLGTSILPDGQQRLRL